MTLPLTPQERFALGQKQRKHMRRAENATFNPRLRAESPAKLLDAASKGRIPALIELKKKLMAASPFGYFRGAVPVMAYDLSLMANTDIVNQLCGDAHVRNMGAFSGVDGRLVFDINDFDESIAGPFEWDVKRMATSLILAGREVGAKESQCEESARTFLDSYRRSVLMFSRMPVRELARFQVHRLKSIPLMSEIFSVAERSTPEHLLESLTQPAAGSAGKKERKKAAGKPAAAKTQETPPSRIFKTVPPNLTRVTGTDAQRVIDSLTTYEDSLLPERRIFFVRYRPLDVAFKVVGTGSVGLRDYCVYMEGNGPKDPLFLQIKEEAVSAYAPYLGKVAASPTHQGRRVVEGERAMQLQSDPFLGWTSMQGRDYLVRQLNDHKGSINLEGLSAESLLEYAAVCGEILARGHSRSGDPAMLAGYIGNSGRFDEAIVSFAIAYAEQTERDWKAHARSMHLRPELPKPTKKKSAKRSADPKASKSKAGKKHSRKKA